MILDMPRYDAVASHGESDVALFIAAKAKEARQALYRTHTFGHAIYEAMQGLASVREECSVRDWDGYGAEPVHGQTIWSAYQLVEALPPGFKGPTVGAEPDGHVTLEWHRSPSRTISVSVSPDGYLHYSALLGHSKQYGTEVFYGEMPQTILDLIRRVYA